MRNVTKKFLAIFLRATMVSTTLVFTPAEFQKNVWAEDSSEESLVTEFSYDFAYSTPGYADGTIRILATQDGETYETVASYTDMTYSYCISRIKIQMLQNLYFYFFRWNYF